jgi:multidrug efflux pump
MLLATYRCFTMAPKGFIPAQDMGYLYAVIQLPDAAAIERTRSVVEHVQQIAMTTPGVKHTMSISGSSFAIGAS